MEAAGCTSGASRRHKTSSTYGQAAQRASRSSRASDTGSLSVRRCGSAKTVQALYEVGGQLDGEHFGIVLAFWTQGQKVG